MDVNQKQLFYATKESPVFAKITVFDFEHGFGDNPYENTQPQSAQLFVACEQVKDTRFEVNKYETRKAKEAVFRILDGEHKAEGRRYEFEEFQINEILPPTNEYQTLYKEVIDSIKCEIDTKLYPDLDIEDSISEYDLYIQEIPCLAEFHYEPEDVHTLEEADEWLLKNHPEQFISMSAHNNIGDFTCGAVPQAYGQSREWATKEGRENIVRQYAKINGFEVGNFDYTLFDGLMESKKDELNKQLPNGISVKEFEQVIEK